MNADEHLPSGPVAATEDLRRLIRPADLDEIGQPTSAPFRTENMSVDVASLCSLAETMARKKDHHVAIVRCQVFHDLALTPTHDPILDNIAHAIVPGKLSQSLARKVRNGISKLILAEAQPE